MPQTVSSIIRPYKLLQTTAQLNATESDRRAHFSSSCAKKSLNAKDCGARPCLIKVTPYRSNLFFLLMLAVTAPEEPGGVLDGVIRGHRCSRPLFAGSDGPREDLLWKQNTARSHIVLLTEGKTPRGSGVSCSLTSSFYSRLQLKSFFFFSVLTLKGLFVLLTLNVFTVAPFFFFFLCT